MTLRQLLARIRPSPLREKPACSMRSSKIKLIALLSPSLQSDAKHLTEYVDYQGERMPKFEQFCDAVKTSTFIVVGILLMGSSGAHADEKANAAKITTGSPGNIRFDTCSRPEYPEQELKQDHQGTVTLQFLIGADGTVKRSLVHTSSGFPVLDEAALAGISKCRFDPPMVDGKPVEGWTAIQYVWKP